ncbi:UNVERIFIED_ORG: hypothetical protein B5F06_13085 [Lacrimispora saccharolytica]
MKKRGRKMHAGVQVLPFFLYSRKLRSLLYKSAPRGSHCGGKETAAFATRRRRRILLRRILS